MSTSSYPRSPATIAALTASAAIKRAAGVESPISAGATASKPRGYAALAALVAAMVPRSDAAGAQEAIPLPVDLAAAIVADYESGPMPAGKIYRDQAGENPKVPYLIFSIITGNPVLTTSTSYWYDQRVRFTAYAGDSTAANTARTAVAAFFAGKSYDFQTGFSIPFFATNHSEGKEPNRYIKNSYLFKAMIEVSARTQRAD